MNETLRKRLIGLAVVLLLVFLLTFLIPHFHESTTTGHAIAVTAVPVNGSSPPSMARTTSSGLLGQGPLAPQPQQSAGAPARSPPPKAAAPQTRPSAPAGTSTTLQTTPPPHTAEPGASSKSNWYVQVGSYSRPENADKVIARLGKLGLRGDTQRATVGGHTYYRVRLGPYSGKTQAEQARDEAVNSGYKGARLISP